MHLDIEALNSYITNLKPRVNFGSFNLLFSLLLKRVDSECMSNDERN